MDIIKKYDGKQIIFHAGESLKINVRRNAIKRCLINLIDNGLSYGKKIEIITKKTVGDALIFVDDNEFHLADVKKYPLKLYFAKWGYSKNQIYKILGEKIFINKKTNSIKAPGQLKLHYSPGIPVRVNVNAPKKNEAFIQFSRKFNKKNYFYLSQRGNLKEAARKLYTLLRLIKNMKYKSIAVSRIPKIGLGLAINDRLNKASYK